MDELLARGCYRFHAAAGRLGGQGASVVSAPAVGPKGKIADIGSQLSWQAGSSWLAAGRELRALRDQLWALLEELQTSDPSCPGWLAGWLLAGT